MVAPAVAMIAAAAIAAAAKGAGDYFSNKQQQKAAKYRAKETKRETQANLLNSAYDRGAALEAHRLGSSGKMGKRRTQSMQDTADLLRGAFNI